MARMFFFVCALSLALCIGFYVIAKAEEEGDLMQCDDREKIQEHLGSTYHEVIIFQGLADSGDKMIEVMAQPDGTTFSVLVSSISGDKTSSCLVGAGSSWLLREIKPIEESEPS